MLDLHSRITLTFGRRIFFRVHMCAAIYDVPNQACQRTAEASQTHRDVRQIHVYKQPRLRRTAVSAPRNHKHLLQASSTELTSRPTHRPKGFHSDIHDVHPARHSDRRSHPCVGRAHPPLHRPCRWARLFRVGPSAQQVGSSSHRSFARLLTEGLPASRHTPPSHSGSSSTPPADLGRTGARPQSNISSASPSSAPRT